MERHREPGLSAGEGGACQTRDLLRGEAGQAGTKADYAEYDYLIGMDSANIRNMLRIFGGDPDGKVARLLSYAGSERDISDPWYTGEFGTTYNDVLEGCTAFLQYLQQNGRIDT